MIGLMVLILLMFVFMGFCAGSEMAFLSCNKLRLKHLAEEGSQSCPITNEPHRWYRASTIIIDADHYTYETFMKDTDGREFRSMVISYTRAQ